MPHICTRKFRLVLRALLVVWAAGPLAAQAQFSQQGPKLVGTGAIAPYGGASGPEQGFSVSLSGDGNTGILGGIFDNNAAGAAWVFTRLNGVWSQQAKLVATDTIGSLVEQGIAVSLSNDGNTAIVGGPVDNLGSGAAWVFTRVNGMWSEQAKLAATDAIGRQPDQGYSASLSGDGNTAIVGGPNDNSSLGAVWVYTRSGSVWSQQTKLVATDVVGNNIFQGHAAALSRDGNTAIVGGYGDNDFGGAAWIFTRSGSVWTEQAKLVATDTVGPYPTQQGFSVSLSSDGSTAIIGGINDNSSVGAAWVFARSGSTWSEQAKLVASDTLGPYPALQGYSVSLSDNGNTAIVAGLGDNGYVGAAWVFTRSGSSWSEQEKLVGSNVQGNSAQGISSSLSGNGSTAMLGRPGDNGFGAAWVFAQPVFAGTPGKSNCYGQSVSALAQQYGGLNNAAAALGYPSVSALQNAVETYCEA
jgi:hypothetical protein